MNSADGDRGRVWELHRCGHTIRAIAARLGLSRSKVHRIIAAGEPATPADGTLADVGRPVGPVELVSVDVCDVAWFADASGRLWNLLELYREDSGRSAVS